MDAKKLKELIERASNSTYDPARSEVEALFTTVAQGTVQLEDDNGMYFNTIEHNYPITANRIDWSLVNETEIFDVDGSSMTERQLNEALLEWIDRAGISADSIAVLVGDDSKFALRASAQEIIARLAKLMEFPQHWYILFDNGRACFQLAIEGYVVAGLAKHAVKKGWTDEQ